MMDCGVGRFGAGMRSIVSGPVVIGIVIVPLLLSSVSDASAQASAPITPASRVESPRIDLRAAVSAHVAGDVVLRTLISSANARGVPADPLLAKVREGIAKGSDGARIREAVRVLGARLESSAAALAPVYSGSELIAGAGALQSGVSVTTLRGLRRVWPDRPVTVPLGVLTEMVADGVPLKLAGTKLRELMQRGATGVQLVALGTSIRDDVAAGYAPGTALELRSKGVFSLLANPLKSTVGPATTPTRPRR